MVNQEGILEHLRQLEEALQDWERYRQEISQVELLKDRDTRNRLLYALLVAIQSAIDVGNHLIAENSLRKPSTYRETFEILAENQLITQSLASSLSDLAGFRNVLVHGYWRFNLEWIYRILHEEWQVLKEFQRIAKRLLEEKSSS